MKLIVMSAAIVLVLYALSLWAFAKAKNYLVALISLFLPSLGVLLDAWLKCAADPLSEACVWAKSFLPLTIGLALSLATPSLYLLVTGMTKVWTRFRGNA